MTGMEKPERHYSQLAAIENCGEAYRRAYAEKQKGTTVRLGVGVAVHEGRSQNLKQKIISGKNLPLDEIQDSSRDCVIQHFEDNELFPEDEYKGLGKPGIYQVAIDTAVNFVAKDFETFQKNSQPISVEESIGVILKNHPFDIGVKIDLIERAASPVDANDLSIRDCKTSSRRPRENLARISEQLPTYTLAFRAKYGRWPIECSLDYTVQKSRGRIENIRLAYTPTEDDCRAVLHRLAIADEAIRKGIFIPCSPNHWKCCDQWCEFYHDCKYVVGR